MNKNFFWIGLMAATLLAGCRDAAQRGHSAAGHHHDPPHGGTAVELGNHEFQLEFLRDATNGRMQAYILSGHMNEFVRITAESFEVTAKLPGQEQTLVFKPVPNAATGETAGDTSLFEATAEWLKTTPGFDAVLKELTIRGKKYSNVPFTFASNSEPGAPTAK